MERMFEANKEFENDAVGTIEGEIPEWLNGTLVRTGPGKWDLDENFSLNHLLDGCAMMVRFDFDQKTKTVRSRSRYLKSMAYQKMCQLKRPVFTEFGTPAFTDTTKSVFSRMINKVVPSDLTDNDLSNIYKINDEVFVTTESCNIWRIDPNSLDSLDKVNLDKRPGISISCSHPIYSEEDKCVYNVGSTFLTGMKYHVMKIPTDLPKAKNQVTSFDGSSIICSFGSSYKGSLAYNHSFAITKNYIIVIEQSLLVNGLKLATCTPKGKSLEECLEWSPDQPTYFHVINKSTNSLLKHKFQTKGFFFFHTINAYEVDDQIVLDILNYDDISLLDALRMYKLRKGVYESTSKSKPTRYVLPVSDIKQMKVSENLVKIENCQSTAMSNGKNVIELTGQLIGNVGFEMPTINPKYIGKEYNFIYGTGFLEKGFFENAIGKLDIRNNTAIVYKNSETTYPGEGVFVARPDAQAEDEGVVLTMVLERNFDKNPYLAVLDAQTLKELAKIEFKRDEVNIPITLHGIWVPNNNSS